MAPAAAPPGTYWVDEGTLLAGAYPGHVDPALASARLGLLLALGVDWFIDLTWPGELPAYDALLPGPYARGLRPPVAYSRRPIRDHGLPASRAQMLEILDEIDEALAGGRRLYVHCRAGIGRTGTVIGCLLARRAGDGRRALAELDRLWRAAGRDRDFPRTPETEPQVQYVRGWREDRLAPAWAATLGPWLYIVVFAIIFCETGLVVTPFLPGDSLLVTAGMACYTADWNLPLL